MIARVPLPPWLPDQTANSGVLLQAENVWPAVDGYRAVPGFAPASDPIDGAFLGGASVIATNGTSYLFVGSAAGLYKFAAGSWEPLVDGLAVADRWRFVQFGDHAITVNGSATREIDLAAGTDSALAGAPSARSIAVVGDYVVVGQADGNILQVQWSAFNDHTGWTPGVDQSGFQPMLTGGEVMGLAGGEYGIVLQRFRLARMTRTGDASDPFAFDEVTPNVGCASRASIVQAGRTLYWLSDRGFMALEDGQLLKPIGNEKVDRSFAAAVSSDDLERIHAAVDPRNSLAMWGVPGTPGTIWVYNWVLDRWSIIRTGFSGLFSGYSSSLTLEELSAAYPDLDAMEYSLDDPRFEGGAPRLYLVDGEGRLGTLSGATLGATLQLGLQELGGGRRVRVQSVRPLCDAGAGMRVTLDCRERLGDTARLVVASSLTASGILPVRASGRHVGATLEIAAGTAWSYAQALELAFAPGGAR